MFDPKSVVIHVPPGPYPICPDCRNRQAELLPIVEPASALADSVAIGRVAVWLEGTAVLKWKCSNCGKEVK